MRGLFLPNKTRSNSRKTKFNFCISPRKKETKGEKHPHRGVLSGMVSTWKEEWHVLCHKALIKEGGSGEYWPAIV